MKTLTPEQAARRRAPGVAKVAGVNDGRPVVLPSRVDAVAVVRRAREGQAVESICAALPPLTATEVLVAVRWGLAAMPG